MEALTGLDASFLYLESPAAPMHVCSLIICDPSDTPGGFTFNKLMSFLEQKAIDMPIFRKRLVEVPLRLYHPVWIKDPDFDIVHHVRHVQLPAPGGEKELGTMAGRLAQGTLDRRYPLWEMALIEGLEGGKVAIFGKFHHAAVDGVTGAGLMAQLFDMAPRQVEIKNVEPPKGDPIPTESELLAYATEQLSKQPRMFAKLFKKSVQNLTEYWQSRYSGKNEEDEEHVMGRSVPPTHINRRIGPGRQLAFATVPLDAIKAIKDKTGTTVNDVVLTICGTALREFLIQHNDLPERSLVATCPVSVHGKTQNTAGANHVSGMRTTLATHVSDPKERLIIIHDEMVVAKEGQETIGADMLQDWAEVVSPHAFNMAVRLYSRTGLSEVAIPHNVIISNVPGPRFSLYLAGAKIEAVYPIGPVFEGCGLNITLFSYADSVDFGFFVDKDMIPDVWDFAELTKKAVIQLSDAVGIQTKKKAVKKTTRKKSKKTTKKIAKKVAKKIAKNKKPAKTALGNNPLAAVKKKSRKV